jgi:hypothetical protein
MTERTASFAAPRSPFESHYFDSNTTKGGYRCPFRSTSRDLHINRASFVLSSWLWLMKTPKALECLEF